MSGVSRMLKLPSCNHGINDDCDMTYRHVVEDFVRGTKVTIVGFWCKAHDRHGTWRIQESTRTFKMPEDAES
jgi:hypothetical protein